MLAAWLPVLWLLARAVLAVRALALVSRPRRQPVAEAAAVSRPPQAALALSPEQLPEQEPVSKSLAAVLLEPHRRSASSLAAVVWLAALRAQARARRAEAQGPRFEDSALALTAP